jgi:hypothetical protein
MGLLDSFLNLKMKFLASALPDSAASKKAVKAIRMTKGIALMTHTECDPNGDVLSTIHFALISGKAARACFSDWYPPVALEG